MKATCASTLPKNLKLFGDPNFKTKILIYESRIDYSDRQAERHVAERRVLFSDVPRAADCTKMSYEMERYTGKESGKGKVYGAVWEEEGGLMVNG